jgi:hypothetical protein
MRKTVAPAFTEFVMKGSTSSFFTHKIQYKVLPCSKQYTDEKSNRKNSPLSAYFVYAWTMLAFTHDMKTLLCASPFIDCNFFAFYSSVLVHLSHGGFMKAGTKILFPYSIATV